MALDPESEHKFYVLMLLFRQLSPFLFVTNPNHDFSVDGVINNFYSIVCEGFNIVSVNDFKNWSKSVTLPNKCRTDKNASIQRSYNEFRNGQILTIYNTMVNRGSAYTGSSWFLLKIVYCYKQNYDLLQVACLTSWIYFLRKIQSQTFKPLDPHMSRVI